MKKPLKFNKVFVFVIILILLLFYNDLVNTSPLSVSTNKSSYKPGETVKIYINGKPSTSYGVEVRDPNNKIVFLKQVRTGSDGKASTQFALSNSAKTGTYKIYVSGGGESATKTFKVQIPPPPPPPPSKKSSSITLSINSTIAKYGEWISINGSLKPELKDQKIIITYISPGGVKTVHEVYTDSNGNFRDEFQPLELGEWSVSASWAGNPEYKSAKTSLIFYVKQLLTIYLDIKPSTVFLGSNIGLSGRIEPAYENVVIVLEYSLDEVEWFKLAETTTSSDGSFMYTYTVTNIGRLYFRAIINETDKFFSSISNVVSVNVRVGVYVELSLTVKPSEVQVGDIVTIEGLFNDSVSGLVEVFAVKGGEQFSIKEFDVANENAFGLEWTPESEGTYIIWARFTPELGTPSTAFATLSVKPRIFKLEYTVLKEDGEPLGNVTVRILKDGVIIAEALTDANGRVSFDLSEGSYNVEFIVFGVSVTEASIFLDSSKYEKIVLPIVSIDFYVSDEFGNALSNTPILVIDSYGVKHVVTTDEKGRAVLDVPKGDVKVVVQDFEKGVSAEEGLTVNIKISPRLKFEYLLAFLILGIGIGLALGRIIYKRKIVTKKEEQIK